MVAEVIAAWGKLDVAVNNAGISLPIGSRSALLKQEWDRLIALNLQGHLLLLPGGGQGHDPPALWEDRQHRLDLRPIVWPEPQAAYSTSKAGVMHLTRCLAAEWAPHGIRVNCVSPGVTRTPELFEQVIPVFLAKAPIGRIAGVEDLAAAVVYLASDAADFVVGHDLVLDGGYTLRKATDGIPPLLRRQRLAGHPGLRPAGRGVHPLLLPPGPAGGHGLLWRGPRPGESPTAPCSATR